MKTQKAKSTSKTDKKIAALQQRIIELELERDQLIRKTNAAVARAQERSYWLDRWQIDLNTLMQKPGAKEFRMLLRVGRILSNAFSRIYRWFHHPGR
jgi:hypothetical protein